MQHYLEWTRIHLFHCNTLFLCHILMSFVCFSVIEYIYKTVLSSQFHPFSPAKMLKMIKQFCLLKLSVGNDLREVGQSSERSEETKLRNLILLILLLNF